MALSLMSNYRKKKSFLVLTWGKFLEALGSGIGTGLVFCLSFSVSNNVHSVSPAALENFTRAVVKNDTKVALTFPPKHRKNQNICVMKTG